LTLENTLPIDELKTSISFSAEREKYPDCARNTMNIPDIKKLEDDLAAAKAGGDA